MPNELPKYSVWSEEHDAIEQLSFEFEPKDIRESESDWSSIEFVVPQMRSAESGDHF